MCKSCKESVSSIRTTSKAATFVLTRLGIVLAVLLATGLIALSMVMLVLRHAGGTLWGGVKRSFQFSISFLIALQAIAQTARPLQMIPKSSPALGVYIKAVSFLLLEIPGSKDACYPRHAWAITVAALAITLFFALSLLHTYFQMMGPDLRTTAVKKPFPSNSSRNTDRRWCSSPSIKKQLYFFFFAAMAAVAGIVATYAFRLASCRNSQFTTNGYLLLGGNVKYAETRSIPQLRCKLETCSAADLDRHRVIAPALSSDSGVLCYQGRHMTALVVAITSLTLVGFVFPLFTLGCAWAHLAKKATHTEVAAAVFGRCRARKSTEVLSAENSGSNTNIAWNPSHAWELGFFLDNEFYFDKFWIKNLDIILIVVYAAIQELLFPQYPIAATVAFVVILATNALMFALYAPYRPPYRFNNYVRVTICVLGIFTACTAYQVGTNPQSALTSNLASATALVSLVTLVVIFLSFGLTLERGAAREEDSGRRLAHSSNILGSGEPDLPSMVNHPAHLRKKDAALIEPQGNGGDSLADRHAKFVLARHAVEDTDRMRFNAVHSRQILVGQNDVSRRHHSGEGYSAANPSPITRELSRGALLTPKSSKAQL
jgi:hypothetical protein